MKNKNKNQFLADQNWTFLTFFNSWLKDVSQFQWTSEPLIKFTDRERKAWKNHDFDQYCQKYMLVFCSWSYDYIACRPGNVGQVSSVVRNNIKLNKSTIQFCNKQCYSKWCLKVNILMITCTVSWHNSTVYFTQCTVHCVKYIQFAVYIPRTCITEQTFNYFTYNYRLQKL